MQDSEKKQDIHYSLSDIDEKQKVCGNYNYRMRKDPFAEFGQELGEHNVDGKDIAPKTAPAPKKDTKQEESERLARLYFERKKEFTKASRTRWLLAFAGFALVFCIILIALNGGDIGSLFSADLASILMILLAGTVLTGFYFFVNVSIFGWLFQKDIAEGRRLDNIEQQIREIEKSDNH